MFRVKGTKRQDRQYHIDLIRKVATDDLGAAIILGAVYFEWCVRRSVVALGKSSVADLRNKMKDRGMVFEKLLELWRAEVCKRYPDIPTLPLVFDSLKKKPRFGKLLLDWHGIVSARKMRNRLVHGDRCTPLEQKGQAYIELLLAASSILADLVESKGRSIFKIIRRDIKKKSVDVAIK